MKGIPKEMAFDGIVTKCVVSELQNIKNYKVDSIFQPNKNTIIFGLYAKGEKLNLLSCIASNNYRIHLTSYSYQNPLISPNFCMLLRKHLIGYKIKKIYSIDLERIVFIDLENNDNPNKPSIKRLIIELMGKHSNVILCDINNIIIDSLRHTSVDDNANRDIYPSAKYYFPESPKYSFLDLQNFEDFYTKIEPKLTEYIVNQSNKITDLNIFDYRIDKIISETFNGISSSFVNNIINHLELTDISKQALNIIYDKINKIINSDSQQISQDENGFYINISEQTKNIFDINYSLDNFYHEKEISELFVHKKGNIYNLVSSELNKYKKRLININTKLKECENKEKYKLYGELITSNLYRIQSKNALSVILENYYDNNNKIEIPLNPQYSPVKNANLYFKKYTKLKNTIDIVNVQKQETLCEIDYLESILYELSVCTTIEDLNAIYDEISEGLLLGKRLNRTKKAKTKLDKRIYDINFNPLKLIIDGYIVYVGRNNKENDYLTCKFAKKTDLWFHTKDTPGSHVILKIPPNEIISEEIIFKVAKIAVQHSKAKNSSHSPVDYCSVSNIKKPSGSKPGFVIYSNNKTVYV